MRQRQSLRNYSRLKYYAFGLIICAFAFVGLYLADQYFIVKDIQVITSEEGVKIRGLENFRQKNILLLSEEEVREALAKNNPFFKDISVIKEYPDRLVVNLIADKAISRLKVNQGFFLLNPTGKILHKEKNAASELPQINYYQQLNYGAYEVGDQIDLRDIKVSLHFSQLAQQTGLTVLSIDIGGVDMIRLNLNNEQILVFSTEKDLELQDYQFERIIHQFKIEGQDFSALDFRFDKPIIKLK